MSLVDQLSDELKRLDCPTACIVITKVGNVYVTDEATLEIAQKMVNMVKKDLLEKA